MPAKPKPAPPTTVVFVRHGTTPTTGKVLPGRARGLHLAESGRAQAQAAAERLRAYAKVAAVYASPLEGPERPLRPSARRWACGSWWSGACSSATSAPGRAGS